MFEGFIRLFDELLWFWFVWSSSGVLYVKLAHLFVGLCLVRLFRFPSLESGYVRL